MKSIRRLLIAATFIGFCASQKAALAQLAPGTSPAPATPESPASFLPPVKPYPDPRRGAPPSRPVSATANVAPCPAPAGNSRI